MYLIVTRSFPPELGGMQNHLWGFSNELSNYANTIFLSINSKVLTADKKDDDW